MSPGHNELIYRGPKERLFYTVEFQLPIVLFFEGRSDK